MITSTSSSAHLLQGGEKMKGVKSQYQPFAYMFMRLGGESHFRDPKTEALGG